MINQELLEYINKKVSEGATKESLISELTTGGWTEADINEAFKKTAELKNSSKISKGITGGTNLIFLSLLLMWLAMFTVDVIANPDYGSLEKIGVAIVWLILLPLLLILNRKSSKKNISLQNNKVAAAPPTTSPKVVLKKYKPLSILGRIAHSIYVFAGLWVLWAFLQMVFFYDGGNAPTIKENNIVGLMFIPVIAIPIYAFFKKK
ncbi:MAG: hypothetical protein WC229_03080 [Candidatus Paceibacterota bacterium]|jgi:hypothetical protein